MFELLITAALAGAATHDLTLTEALRQAGDKSPEVARERHRVDAAEAEVRVFRSRYLPEVSANAIVSTGDPGSFSMLDVDANISSAQRVGGGAALVLKQDVWDFGRTGGAVEQARGERELGEKRQALSAAEVNARVLRAYVDCSFLRARVLSNRFTAEQARLIAKEVQRFVKSGQRSIVERYLVDAEAKEAETKIAENEARLEVLQARLATELGLASGEKANCRGLDSLGTELDAIEKRAGATPALDFQKARVTIAKARLARAKAESRPALFAMATGGYFDNEHTRDRMNYAVGLGVKMPLFEGGRLSAEEDASEAQVYAEEAGLLAAALNVARANSKYDEQIHALRVRLDFLREERTLADRVLALARGRYNRMEGTMLDLRESIRNVNRILQSTDEALRDLSVARGERSFVNLGAVQ